MSIRRLAFLLGCLFGITPLLNAAVSERDFFAPSDGLLTYDDLNYREWLDINETLTFDTKTIIASTLPGGSLHGFSIATRDDFEGLALSANLDWINPESLTGIAGVDAKVLISLVGETTRYDDQMLGDMRVSSAQISIGLSSAGQFPTFDGTRAHVLSLEFPPPNRSINNGMGANTQIKSAGGVYTAPVSELESENGGPFWLYRAAIPEPSSIALLVLGIGICTTRQANRC